MNAPVLPAYRHTPLFPLGQDRTTHRKLDCDGVRIERALGREIVVVAADATPSAACKWSRTSTSSRSRSGSARNSAANISATTCA